jgi:hypothetical protein
LRKRDRELFAGAITAIVNACAPYNADPVGETPLAVNPPWPQLISVEEIKSSADNSPAGGLYTMVWNPGSTGRATFAWHIDEERTLQIVFRRIGYI